MSVAAVRAVPSEAAARLEAAAVVVLALVPLGMAVANRSAPALVIVAALLALGARAAAGEIADMTGRLGRALRSPVGLASLACLAFAAVSLAWSHHIRISAAALGEALLAGGAPLVLWGALPRPLPRWAVTLAAVAVALGCLSIVGELATDLALRAGLGFRHETFIFKRSATAILIVAWPILWVLWTRGSRGIAAALAILVVVASVAAHSSATLLGFAVGLALVLASRLSVRTARFATAALLLVAFTAAPFIGEAANRLIPERMVDRMEGAHARDRIEIWRSFGAVVRDRPVLGTGFGTSAALARDPVAAEVPEERRLLLGAWHPHDGYLQVWAETGAVGAVLAALALVLLATSLASPAAFAILASAGAIMLVGHGAWQGWWIATLGGAAIWTRLCPAQSDAGAPRKPVAST